MFKKKKQKENKKQLYIKIVKNNGDVFYEGKLYKLPLKEDYIIKKSIDFFDDPSPCYIHRTAVMCQLYAKLEEFLITNEKMVNVYDIMSEEIKKIIDVCEDINEVIYFEND